MAFEKASCNETLLLRTASQELHVDTAVGYTQRGGPRCWRKRYLVHFVDQGVVNDQLLITQTRTRAERSQIHPSPFPATKTAPPPHAPADRENVSRSAFPYFSNQNGYKSIQNDNYSNRFGKETAIPCPHE